MPRIPKPRREGITSQRGAFLNKCSVDGSGCLFDHRHGLGFMEERLVNGVDYVGSTYADETLRWRVFPDRRQTMRYLGGSPGGLDGSANPDEVLEVLSQAGAQITQNSGGYHFEYADTTPSELRVSDEYAGDVVLDQSGRIATVTYVRTIGLGKPGWGSVALSHLEFTMEFSSYGTPVIVEEPAEPLDLSSLLVIH